MNIAFAGRNRTTVGHQDSSPAATQPRRTASGPPRFRWVWRFTTFLLLTAFASPAFALPQKLGDLDEDGRATVIDIVRIVRHFTRAGTLSNELAVFADVNQDGFVNETDAAAVAEAALGLASLPDLPLARIHETSPANLEGGVAVTRESVLRFTIPLSTTTVVATNRLYAQFGGRHLLSRIELSSDRRTVTLFYLEPLPGSSRVRVQFDGNGLTDAFGRQIDADGDGVPGGVTTLDFDTLNLTPLPRTAVIGRVFASELVAGAGTTNAVNRPLAGVTITVDGMEETLRTVTDAQGNFKLEPAPAGRFFRPGRWAHRHQRRAPGRLLSVCRQGLGSGRRTRR